MAIDTAAARDGVLGQPRGLSTLFLTEMWERLSYYGMRALLVLFMVDSVAGGGLGLDDRTATAIYGIYTASVYLMALPGGWLADRLVGAQRAVWWGGLIIMSGHFVLAIPAWQTFYLGLILVVLGTGLLKPNISALVGELYDRDDPRRDSGFTIFYMGINLGAVLGPLVCSTLGESERFGWHWGFGAAGVGMLLGVAQFRLSRHQLGETGRRPTAGDGDAARTAGGARLAAGAFLALIVSVYAAGISGVLHLNALVLAGAATSLIVAVGLAYFVLLWTGGGLSPAEKRHVGVIFILFIAAAMFWSGFEQAGSSLNLFAERYTQRLLAGFEIPAGWFQSLNPAFIIILAPAFAALWVRLARRGLDPSTPVKFAIGLILLGAGFLVMVLAAWLAAGGSRVAPNWLILTYLLHTMGELALSPVGLSSVTRLAPRRYVGQMMGVWFLAASLGSLLAGLLAGRFNPDHVEEMPGLYLQIVMTTVGAGLLLLLFAGPIRRLMEAGNREADSLSGGRTD